MLTSMLGADAAGRGNCPMCLSFRSYLRETPVTPRLYAMINMGCKERHFRAPFFTHEDPEAAYFVRRVLPPPLAPAEHARLLKETMRELNSYGIVSVVDPGVDERHRHSLCPPSASSRLSTRLGTGNRSRRPSEQRRYLIGLPAVLSTSTRLFAYPRTLRIRISQAPAEGTYLELCVGICNRPSRMTTSASTMSGANPYLRPTVRIRCRQL
jgi:hypothetical protein